MGFKDAISVYAFAKHAGISRTHAKRLIEGGVLKADDNGMLSQRAASKAYKEYQAQLKDSQKDSKRGKKTAEKVLDELREHGGENFKALYDRWIAEVENDPMVVLNAARAYLTAIQTKEEKLKLDELERRLIPVEEINADAEQIGTIIRSKLLSLPARVATLCEGRKARDIEELLTDEINSALEDLQKLFV